MGDDPVERLVCFVRHARDGAELLSAQGCPIGGLCTDLARTNADLGAEAGKIFAATIDWVTHQYAALDHASPGQAASRLVALVQGATVLSHALRDPEILRAECVRAEQGLRASRAPLAETVPDRVALSRRRPAPGRRPRRSPPVRSRCWGRLRARTR